MLHCAFLMYLPVSIISLSSLKEEPGSVSFNSNFYDGGYMVFSINSSGTKGHPHETE